MKPTMKDVARLANVSMSTVSRVLNRPDSVRADKRKEVLKVIKELNYHPNALARGLIYKRTGTIGVLMTDISNTYVPEVVRGMEDAAHESGDNLILCNTDRNKERMISYLKVLKEKQVDGIVFTSEPVTTEYHEMFSYIDLPVVLASTHCLDYELPSVKIDDERASFDATEYLIDKGHKKIAMISGPLDDPISGSPRVRGYKQALQDYKIVLPDTWIEYGQFKYEDGVLGVRKLIERHPDVTAIYAANDEMALGAISYLHEQGINVPGDISIIGFDNTRFSRMSIPKLTTVAQPMYNIGYQSVKKLEDVLTNGKVEELRTVLSHQIVERDSVKSMG